MNLSETAKQQGTVYSTLYRYRRIHPSAPIEELVAMTKKAKSWGDRDVEKHQLGDLNLTIPQWADHVGVNVNKFRYRVNTYGLKKAVELGNKSLPKGRPKGSKTKPFKEIL